MPVSARIDRLARIVFTTATGVLERSDFIRHIEQTWSDNTILSFDELIDATKADASQLSAEDLAAIVNSGVVLDPVHKSRLALCVDSDLAFGLGRMFSMMRETHFRNSRTIQVFRDLEAARAWLDETDRD